MKIRYPNIKNIKLMIKNLVSNIKEKNNSLTQEKKNEIGISYIKQIQEYYDKQSKDEKSNPEIKIGANIHSLEFMVIETKILTHQLNVTDELLVALEEFIIKETI
jgi:hypothetical protein